MEVQATWDRAVAAAGERSPRRSAGCATSPPCASPTTRCSCGSCRCTTPSCRPSDVDDRKLDDVYAVAVAHLALGRVRAPGRAVARVLSPDRDRDGWHSPHSVLLVVTDDMPFLVDTMRMVLERRGLGVHLLVHPMLRGQRDDEHRLVDVAPDTAGAGGAARGVDADRDRPHRRRRRPPSWRPRSSRAVDDVQRVVDDFPAMRDRMEALGDVDPILPWLADGQFVFLGAADYDVGADGALDAARRAASSAWPATTTACTSPRARCRPTAPSPSPAPTTPRRSSAPTARRWSPSPTAGAAPDALRRPAGDERLPGQRARHPRRRRRPSPTPSTSPRRGCTRTPGGRRAPCSRTCRATSCSSSSRSALARLVAAIVGLQERQLVRVFEVPEPVGPWVTVLVYLPRDRFTAELPERVADAVAAAYGADQRTFESRRRRQLAGPHRGQRPLRRRPAVDRPGDARADDRRAVDVVVRPAAGGARRRGRRGPRPRPVRARRRARPAGVPGGRRRRSGRSATSAASPSLLDGDRELATSLGRDVDAPPGEWRFRVYRRGTPAALSELLPLLDHLGLQALDERPYTFRVDRPSGCSSTTSASASPPASSSTSTAERRCRTPSPRLVAGDVESDGFNRLVLLAGLSAREVAMVRAYGKYLRQIGFAFSQSYIEDALSSPSRCSSPISSSCSTPASTRRASPAWRATQRDGTTATVRRASRRRRSTPSRASTTTASAAPS